MNRAPKGGITAQINGQRYEGGEFLPEHGLFCGKAGAKRAKRRDQAKARGRYVEMVSPEAVGAAMFQVYERDADPIRCHVSYAVGVVVALTEAEARTAFGGRPRLWAEKV